MKAPTVSVVIPSFNGAQFIAQTLDAVRAQTRPADEVILVDDGSKDGTGDVAEAYFARTKWPGRVIRQENKKIAAARNAGMRAATGEFIALLDHDDLWYPEKLETVMAELARDPGVDMICHIERIVENGKAIGVTRLGTMRPPLYERLLFGGNALSPSGTVFKRAKAMEIGGFRENLEFNTVEDYDFWMRFSRIGTVRFMDKVLGDYQLVERRVTRAIEYHHANLESLLRDHFRSYFGERPGLLARLWMGRRLSVVYRSALAQLAKYREAPEKQRAYALRMLRACPFEPKNWARLALWAAGR